FFYLPESYSGNKDFSLRPTAIIGKFWQVFTNKTFLSYCLVGSIASSGLYAYLAGSSFVMQQYFGLSQTEYCLAFAFVASPMIVAAQIARVRLQRWSCPQIIIIANLCQSVISCIMLGYLLRDTLYSPILLSISFCDLLEHGFIFPK